MVHRFKWLTTSVYTLSHFNRTGFYSTISWTNKAGLNKHVFHRYYKNKSQKHDYYQVWEVLFKRNESWKVTLLISSGKLIYN